MSSGLPIEIVGGGLAGLSLGLALRRANVPVTILEAGTYPRHRVCGEFIAGLDPETEERLGLGPMLADARRHRSVAWFLKGQAVRNQRLPAPAHGLSRYVLDHRIATEFTAAGGWLRTGARVTDLTPRPGRVFAQGRRADKSPWLGLKVHVTGLTLHRDLELHLGDEAYVGLATVEDGRVNVCGLFRRRQLAAPGAALLFRYLEAAGLHALADRLSGTEVDDDSFCAVAGIRFASGYRSHPGVHLGDAGGMVPPFTGNGMAMAFQSAATALGPLICYSHGECSWAVTCERISRLLARRFRVRLASASWLHGYLLRPSRQRWLAALNRAHLLPLRPLYAALH
ncbi:MAG TPA: NAD(P)-binding protein [Candidatus Didemnitutus sp.]|nr:NAD(P)-binding protein [Candidatus Didemnitutus sp.]